MRINKVLSAVISCAAAILIPVCFSQAQNLEVEKYAVKYSFQNAGELLNTFTTIPNDSCHEAIVLCNNSIYPASTNNSVGEIGPAYQCLQVTSNPAWFIIHTLASGSLALSVSSVPLRDIDFICWGNFNDPASPCTAGLTFNKVVDCDYSTSPNPVLNINSAVADQYYLVMVTNYSNQPCNITFTAIEGEEIIQSSQEIDISISEPEYCVSTVLTASEGFESYLWNTGATSQSIVVDQGGNYSVTGFNSGCSAFSQIVVNDPQPTVPAGDIFVLDSTYCYSTTLTAPNGYISYQWNSGQQTQSIEINEEGLYSVIATFSNGCKATSSIYVRGPAQPFIGQEICMVTFNNNNKKNLVILERNSNVGIDSLLLFRKSDQENSFNKIVVLGIDQELSFNDYQSFPSETVYSYAVSVKDTCGKISALSEPHNTILLNGSIGPYNTINLTWNAYMGLNYNTFEVYRNTNNGPYILIGTADITSCKFTDLMPLEGRNSYQIKLLKFLDCTINNPLFESIYSNTVEFNIVGDNEMTNESIHLYPNPVNDLVILNTSKDCINGSLFIADLYGRILIEQPISETRVQIDVSKLLPGPYTFSIRSNDRIASKLLIVN